MNWKLKRILVFIAAAPVMLMAWLGVRTARMENERLQSRLEDSALQQITERSASLAKVVEQIRVEGLQLLSTDFNRSDREQLRDLPRSHPLVRQFFIVENDRLVFPDPLDDNLNAGELAFLERTSSIWKSGETFYHESDADNAPPSQQILNQPTLFLPAQNDNPLVQQPQVPFHQVRQAESPNDDNAPAKSSGWHTWFHDNGLNFILWSRNGSGRLCGIELERGHIISRIIDELPSAQPQDEYYFSARRRSASFLIRLINAQGEPLYQWGSYDVDSQQIPTASVALKQPLGSWRIEQFTPPLSGGPFSTVSLSIILAVIAVAVAVSICMLYVYREHTRLAREASQRVSFVNQVSHELKTPLTNIQMYAELLARRVDRSDDKSARYLEVVTSESRRLGRMINNVLAFARHQRGKLRLQYSVNNVGEVIAATLEAFTPSFEKLGIAVRAVRENECSCSFDRDVLEQILGNLLSNVEKYAGKGTTVDIHSLVTDNRIEVIVHDDGPGIPPARRKDVFEPFVRLNDRLTEGVTGTGIGLSIARDLARLHGGDLELLPTEQGACFKITLKVSG